VASVNVRSSKISARRQAELGGDDVADAPRHLELALGGLGHAVSSMVSAITAAPYFITSGITASMRSRPFSRLIELTTRTARIRG
jgi:hypothetical protein